MSDHFTKTCAARVALLTSVSVSLLAGAPATGRATSAPAPGAATNSVALSPAKPRVEVSLVVGHNWRRVELNATTLVGFAASGAVEGTNRVEFLVDEHVVAVTAAVGERPLPAPFGSASFGQSQPFRAQVLFVLKPANAGNHEVAAKLTTARGEVFTAGLVVVEAARLQPPTLRFREQPPTHLWTTQAFNLVLEAKTWEGKEMYTTLVRDERERGGLKDFIVTNGPFLALRHPQLPAGVHDFEAYGNDDHGMSSQTLHFTCTVDPVEQAGTLGPEHFMVEPATLPRQTRPRSWYVPGLTNNTNRIAGAPDALQLYWELPTNGVRSVGTLVQRLDPGAQAWKTLAVLPAGVREWRNRGLLPAHYYKYRIAFLCDDVFRTPFSPAAGESTSF